MNSKKKLWLSIASLCLVIVIGVTSVAVVFAALSANVNNNFEIHYTAHNVKASLIGSYSVGGTTTVMNVGGQKGIITYEGTESEDKTFDDIGSFDIEAGQSVEIDYTILNYDEKELPVSATLVNAPTNLNVTYETSIFNGETTKDASTTLTPSTPSSAINVPYSNGETITNACDALDTYYAQKCAEANPRGYLDKEFSSIVPSINKKTLAVALIITIITGVHAIADVRTSSSAINIKAPIMPMRAYLQFPVEVKAFLGPYYASESALGAELYNRLSPGFVRDSLMYGLVRSVIENFFVPLFNNLSSLAGTNYSAMTTWKSAFASLENEILVEYNKMISNNSDPLETLKTIYNFTINTATEQFGDSKYTDYTKIEDAFIGKSSQPETTLDALTWFNDCKAAGVPCAHIKIKFEIADPSQAASFNGGLNLKLGQL